jgi:hypothetical protein
MNNSNLPVVIKNAIQNCQGRPDHKSSHFRLCFAQLSRPKSQIRLDIVGSVGDLLAKS